MSLRWEMMQSREWHWLLLQLAPWPDRAYTAYTRIYVYSTCMCIIYTNTLYINTYMYMMPEHANLRPSTNNANHTNNQGSATCLHATQRCNCGVCVLSVTVGDNSTCLATSRLATDDANLRDWSVRFKNICQRLMNKAFHSMYNVLYHFMTLWITM